MGDSQLGDSSIPFLWAILICDFILISNLVSAISVLSTKVILSSILQFLSCDFCLICSFSCRFRVFIFVLVDLGFCSCRSRFFILVSCKSRKLCCCRCRFLFFVSCRSRGYCSISINDSFSITAQSMVIFYIVVVDVGFCSSFLVDLAFF